MGRAFNFQRLACAIAVVLLVLSAIFWLWSNREVANPGAPTYNGQALHHLQAVVPSIDVFENFYVNNDNPFVPFQQRVPERIAVGPKVPRNRTPAPKPPNPVPPPRPPVAVIETKPRPLKLPRLTPAAATAPVCIGMIGEVDKQMLMVRMPGSENAVPMNVGESIDEWKLLGIDNGNQARFSDPSGSIQVFPIGEGDLAVAQTLVTPEVAPSTAPPKPAPAQAPKVPPGAQPAQPGQPRPPKKRPPYPPAQPPGGMPPQK